MGIRNLISTLLLISLLVNCAKAGDVLGCGGFVKSHAPIDFSKIEVKLFTKQGNLKDSAFCAPNNGYYFVPLYDKGDYILKINPPAGWSFKPQQVELNIDGSTDICSKGGDVNFVFQGFGITGKVDNIGGGPGPSGVTVKLIDGSVVTETKTSKGGNFYFTPVYPGKYTLVAWHSKWKLKKDRVDVQVATSNAEVPKDSLLIGGYDVSGSVTFESKPLARVHFILFNQGTGPVHFEDCSTKDLISFTERERKLCHVSSDDSGMFVFPSLSPARYRLVPFFEEENIKYHVVPSEAMFQVTTESVHLKPVFTVTSFTVKGHVFTNVDGKSVPDATVFLDGEQVARTKNDGSFLLENLVAGSYKLMIEAPGLKFDMEELKISSNVAIRSEFYPSSFQVCGNVASDISYEIVFSCLESKINLKSIQYTTLTDEGTGDFCTFLPPGKYGAVVKVSPKEKTKGVQFFPVEQTFSLSDHPQMGLFFSQLKATVSGRVKCLRPMDCADLQVVINMKLDSSESNPLRYVVPLDENAHYNVPNVVPGTYQVSLDTNRFCWDKDQHSITLISEHTVVPDFLQKGYVIVFKASHDTQLDYSSRDSKNKLKLSSVQISRGTNKVCVERAGIYEFTPRSCHQFDSKVLIFNTEGSSQDLILTASKHQLIFDIKTDVKSLLTVDIKTGESWSPSGPLKFTTTDKGYLYQVELHLAENEEAVVVPRAETLWFQPSVLTILGRNDCSHIGTQIIGLQGKLIHGKVSPVLENVNITVRRSDGEVLVTQTDKYGKYKFPTMDSSITYEISATKESYFFTRPDDKGTFMAHKLAEIIVQAVDNNDGAPLQGALISLSGAESYRSNLQTDNDGGIRFTSLSPSDYFLRPMMKEYNFDPPSKMISVKEGATVNVKLSGKRVAYSAYGSVHSLSGEPESQVVITATPIGDSDRYSEEATSESNGNFRIRGLQPDCFYQLGIKQSLDVGHKIVKSLPEFIPITIGKQDVHGIKLVVIHQVANMDIIALVTSPDPDNFKNLRVKVFRDSLPNNPVFNVKLDAAMYKSHAVYNPGVLVHLPPLPLDNNMYYIRLDCVSSQGAQTSSAEPHAFHTNVSFKYFNLDYNPNANSSEHHIGQTSLLTLPFLALCAIAFYYRDRIFKLFMDLFGRIDVHNFRGIFQRVASLPSPERPTADDIDQLVQNINAPKRKLKVRKT